MLVFGLPKRQNKTTKAGEGLPVLGGASPVFIWKITGGQGRDEIADKTMIGKKQIGNLMLQYTERNIWEL